MEKKHFGKKIIFMKKKVLVKNFLVKKSFLLMTEPGIPGTGKTEPGNDRTRVVPVRCIPTLEDLRVPQWYRAGGPKGTCYDLPFG